MRNITGIIILATAILCAAIMLSIPEVMGDASGEKIVPTKVQAYQGGR